ncbi:hypothetical protein BYT27DRAFT_6359486 [Phlegmacium glaucopus]|nr:hypothetical protein BYT27DRAFT_6359486 [Phlegmacium glaucopus]
MNALPLQSKPGASPAPIPAPTAPTNVGSTQSKSQNAVAAASTGLVSGSAAAAEQVTATSSAFTLPDKKLSASHQSQRLCWNVNYCSYSC